MIHFILTQLASMRKQRMANCQSASGKQKNAEAKIFNDPIHGHIELPDVCVKIINTPEFLRLRNVKQLGATYLVFPGASHNRFEHCIGVSHLAGEFGKHLRDQINNPENAYPKEMKIDERDIICLQVAGLCHDIGHGPMSHAFESRFVRILKPESKWKHEQASCDMFKHLLEKHKEIRIIQDDKELISSSEDKSKIGKEEEKDRAFIRSLILGKKEKDSDTGRGPEKDFLYEVVSNDVNGIDVDKFDYFARDCYHLGFKNNFDHKRLIKFSRVMKAADGAWHICYRDKQVEDIYHMFLSRVILHQRACMHKTVQVLERMYMEVLENANDAIIFTGKKGKKCTILESINDMEAYAKLTDNVFFDIQHSDNKKLEKSKQILERINTRRHYKLISEAIPPKTSQEEYSDIIEAEKRIRKEIIDLNVKAKSNKNLKLKDEDLLVDIVFFSFRGQDNPVDKVYFYNKGDFLHPFRMKKKDVSHLLPDTYCERHIRLYARSEDQDVQQEAKKSFKDWCTKKKMDGKWQFDLKNI